MAGIMDMVRALLGSDPPTVTHDASQPTAYPSHEDVKFARRQDYSYGQPWAPYFEGDRTNVLVGDPNERPMQTRNMLGTPPGGEDFLAKGALAVQNSALASLGFDPTKVAADFSRDPKNVNILGLYRPKQDEIYSNALRPSNIVHESIHRGIEKLRATPFWQKKFDELEGPHNEDIVRWLMKKKMGDPESDTGPAGLKERNQAEYEFEGSPYGGGRRKLLDEMEKAASEYMAKKHPGGPR